MSKMAYALTSVVLIEMGLYFFSGSTNSNTSLFSLILNPTLITTSTFYIIIATAAAVFAASQIIPGNLWQINIYGIYAGIVAIILTFLSVIANMYSFVYGQLSGIFITCSTGGVCPANLIAGLFITPFLIFYTITTADWIRSNL